MVLNSKNEMLDDLSLFIAIVGAGSFNSAAQQHCSGNVRELRNIIEKAITMSDEDYIDIQQLQPAPHRGVLKVEQHDLMQSKALPIIMPNKAQNIPEEGLEQYLEKVEKEVLLSALNQTHWNRTLAAKKLGVHFF